EAMTGRRPTHFCWPSGVYWPEQVATLEAEGVETGTTCDPGLATPSSRRLLLPRFIDTSLVDELTFRSWVDGPAAWMSYRTAAGGYRKIDPWQPQAHRVAPSSNAGRG